MIRSEPGKAIENYMKIAEAFNHQRELYYDLTNALPSGIYRTRVFHDASLISKNWSSSDDAPYVIEFANDRFFEILNLDRLDIEKNPGIISELIFDDDKAEFARMNVEANLNVTTFLWEGRFKINNDKIWIHFESIPRVLENGDIIWTGILNDISKRKNAELEIELKNRELQHINADKDRFISILAHDLRSPLNNVLGFSELLAENIQEYDTDQIKEIAGIINKSAIITNMLLEDILLWAMAQQGSIAFKPEQLSLSVTCRSIHDILDPSADAKNIKIINSSEAEISVYADAAMLKTILLNLVSNAIKFTNSGGTIKLNAAENYENVTISVSDNGVGIPPENMAKLFDISEVISTKGTAKEIGTGLGLLLCKEFVEKHGGKIWVESVVGKGSDFMFTLPFNASIN